MRGIWRKPSVLRKRSVTYKVWSALDPLVVKARDSERVRRGIARRYGSHDWRGGVEFAIAWDRATPWLRIHQRMPLSPEQEREVREMARVLYGDSRLQ